MLTPGFSAAAHTHSHAATALHIHNAGLEDEPEDTAPAQQERQTRYDDEGLDSEDDFIDDDIGEGAQGQRPRRARSKIRTDGVHSQAVQVMQP